MYPMGDVIVLIPGITGSVLQKDGRDLWAVSGGAIVRALRTLGRNLDALRIDGVDDHTLDDLGDGVTATRLMPDLHLVPGLWRIDGYGLVSRTIKTRFDVHEGKNYFEFPYDWRRDNRVHARRLRRCTHDWLRTWRQESGNADAKLVLIAHSMGGLVARDFLEREGGWEDTRSLITFGTPFAGSLNALGFVANGFSKGIGPLSVDLSDALRSMSSVYQLLPVYPSVDDGSGELRRPSQTVGIPHLDSGRADEALAWHRELNQSAERRAHATGLGYATYPIVGYAQPTFHSATLDAGHLVLLRAIDGNDPGGDGTVPRPSAIPAELQDSRRLAMFSAEIHGSLQNAGEVIEHLTGLLLPDYDPVKFKALAQTISLDVQDTYSEDEEIVVRGMCSEPGAELVVSVSDTETGAVIRSASLLPAEAEWQHAVLRTLPAGSYRLVLSAPGANAQPVHDLFVVFPRD